MPIEVEQKFYADDLAAIGAAVVRLGGVSQPAVRQEDRYFAHPARDFAQTDEALRLRRVGDRCVVTYKGPKFDATTKSRREIELPLAEAGPGAEATVAAWAELLTTLGFRPVLEVAKTRTPFHLRVGGRDVEVALDEVAGLGSFVEIETVAEPDDFEAARTTVEHLAQQLSLGASERRSYLELLLACDA